MDWESDWELRARMVTVVGLLLASSAASIYLVLRFAVAPLLGSLGVRLPDVVAFDGPLGLAVAGGLVIVGVALELLASQVLTGPDRALGSTDRGSSDALRGRVTRLAQQADTPAPDVAVSVSTTPTAYTTGVTARRATVVVTTGMLDLLDDDELDAVLAHELAHVKNNDATVMTAVSLVEVVAHRVLSLYSRGDAEDDEADTESASEWHFDDEVVKGRLPNSSRIASFLESVRILVELVYVIVIRQSFLLLVYLLSPVIYPLAWLFWALGRVLTRVLSRYRELAADRGAAAITGSPAALASALEKLDRSVGTSPGTDLRTRERAQRSFFVVPVPEAGPDRFDLYAYTGYGVNHDRRPRYVDLLMIPYRIYDRLMDAVDVDSHPATERRIARLRASEAGQESI